jgi:hypothetical protein
MDNTQTTWEPFPEDSGSLNVPRSSMPQIKSEHRGAMTQFLKGRGISHEQVEVAPNTLKPSQAEYSPEKVEKARNFEGPNRSILISNDGHVLDGHHQWLAALRDAPNEPYPAIRFNAPIQQLLVEAARFPSSGVDEASTSQTVEQQPAQETPTAQPTQTTQQTTSEPLMDEQTFAAKIKAKHPEYEGLDDAELTRRVLDKYPEYQSTVRLSSSASQPATSSGTTAAPVSQFNPQSWLNLQPQPQPMDEHEFARRIKQQHPEYESLDDAELSRRVLNKYPDYRPLVRLSDVALKPSVTSTINEDADFSDEAGAIKDYKPLDLKEENPTLAQRAARGAMTLSGVDGLPAGHPDSWLGELTAVVPAAGHLPSRDELSAAMLNAMGGQAAEVGRRYKNETGRNIVEPEIDDTHLQDGYDEASKTYRIKFNPTLRIKRVIDAYGRGGLPAVESEESAMEREAQDLEAKQAAEKQKIEDAIKKSPVLSAADEIARPAGKGIADAGLGASRLINNMSGLVRDPHNAARDAETLQAAQASIPEEKTAAGKMIRGVTGGVMSAPRYLTPAAPVVAYTENLDRGQVNAVESALPLVVAGGAGRMVGGALNDAAPVVRQTVARGTAGLTNAGMAYAGGERDPSKLVSAGVIGAAQPIGTRSVEPEFASTRPLSDALATPSMQAEQFTHPVLGNLTATADQSGIPPEMVRVQDEGNNAPFVVRRPNAQGQGGVSYADSNSADTAASSAGRTPSTTEQISNVLNVPRAIQTSLDTHSLFRQAAVSFGSHPVKTLRNYFQSLPALWSEENAGRMLNEIQSSPLAPVRQEAGLYLADYTSKPQPLSAREENFMSNLVGKIPGVRGSQRQFTVFLDKVRADAFDNYVQANPEATPETLQGIARFINYSTGRGDLGSFGEQHALGLSNIFYSPRFAASRVQLATTPFRGTPEARAYATQNLLRYVGTNVGLMMLAKAGGLNVGVNPLSSDFGTIKAGDTRISLWGGMDKTARYTAQLLMGQSASADTGNTHDRSRLDTALTFIRTKLAPQTAVLVDAATGTDFKGQPATVGNEAQHLFTPISWNDIIEAVRSEQAQGRSGWWGAFKAAPGLLGAAVQTIAPKTDDEKLNQAFMRLRSAPENLGVPDEQVKHNARVAVTINDLVDSVAPAQQAEARHILNERFYWARVRPGDRRQFSSIQRVFNEQSQGAGEFLKKKLDALK